ncbi:hypothetical protein NC652_029593 [Populus alba x Populus x berolinensis]|nr:hypothetical protein NC652_029593 [Populus alba x Populus x berolinensis]
MIVAAVMLFMLKTVVRYIKRLDKVPMVPSFSNVSFPETDNTEEELRHDLPSSVDNLRLDICLVFSTVSHGFFQVILLHAFFPILLPNAPSLVPLLHAFYPSSPTPPNSVCVHGFCRTESKWESETLEKGITFPCPIRSRFFYA